MSNETPVQPQQEQAAEAKAQTLKPYEKPAIVEYTNIFTDAFAY